MLGPVLIAINPFNDVHCFGNDFITAYKEKLFDNPHVFAVADIAYNEMMRDEVNQSIIISNDTRQFAVSLRQGPPWPWPFTTIQKKKKLYLALFNGKNVFSIQYPPKSENTEDEKVAKGHISLNQEHCKSLDVSLGDTIPLQVFAPPPNGFDVDVLRIMVELLPESSTPTQIITAFTLGREFRNTFHHQVFTEYQRVVFAYKGSLYACSVMGISLGENEGSESLRSTKQGMIRKRTKVIVEVPPQSLAFRVTEQEGLFNDLRNFGAPVPHRRSLTMARRNVKSHMATVNSLIYLTVSMPYFVGICRWIVKSRDLGHLSKAVHNQLYKRLKVGKFGKRHFVMPKYYRDPCGLVEQPSDNQTGYGLTNARLLKWPALFIERIQKEDPDNVDRLCERLQREISQMGRRLARDMQQYIVKKDAQKNKIEPNDAAIKGIMEDPQLVSDAELSDCSDFEPPTDLSVN
ncbi:unnamed protein product [Camellia sinensis]